MDPNQEIQSEDNHTVEEPKKEVIAPVEEPKPGKSLGARILPWVIVILVSLLAGAAAIFFGVYQPKVTAIKADFQAAQNSLDTTAKKLSTSETDLALAQTNLSTANATVDDLTSQLSTAQQFSMIYKFQADVNAARVALLKLDPASSLQAINFIKVDLADLEKTTLDPNAIAGFKDRIAEAESNLAVEPSKSLAALDTLYNNLLFLISNLK